MSHDDGVEVTRDSTSTKASNPKPLQDPALQDLAFEVYDVIKDIKDPEKPETLEELEVVRENGVFVSYLEGVISGDALLHILVEFTPTVPHCSLATLIGLCIRVKIQNYFGRKHKLDIRVAHGTHNTEADINKQINDKERVAAAMENESLKSLVDQCIKDME